ncbi:Putative multidrug resistance protein MdtD [Streptomyces glaucescens]
MNATPAPEQAPPTAMSDRQILQAMSGLMAGMFVAILAGTVVSNALPRIIADLGASQSSYTWVVTAELLAMTATVPLWGKLSDLYNQKLLLQLSLGMFVVGSLLAGFSHEVGLLIFSRVAQGIGAGGLTALAQVVMAAIIPPRGWASTPASSAPSSPSAPWPGRSSAASWWRSAGSAGAGGLHPRAVRAAGHRAAPAHPRAARRPPPGSEDRLPGRLPDRRGRLRAAHLGLAGGQPVRLGVLQIAALTGAGVVLLAIAVRVESRAAEPVIPLDIFRNRTITLTTVASLFVGVAMFGGTVFLSQYFQVSLKSADRRGP